MSFQDLNFFLHEDIIGKSFRYVKDKGVKWTPEDYTEEIRLLLKKIADEEFPREKGVFACDILQIDKPNPKGTKSAKNLKLFIDGKKKFYSIELLFRLASYLNRTVAGLLLEIEIKIASKKNPS